VERLTERNKNRLAMAACCGKACEYNYVCEVGGFGECRGMDDIIDRLADIEDILGDDYDLDRLRELVEADRDGRCVMIPCKVGDTAWFKTYSCNATVCRGIQPHTVKAIRLYAVVDGEHADVGLPIEHFEKSWFLTEKDSLAALKGEQNG
jgi:hypothetical protein